jgi:hypothetical protein
MDAGCIVDFLKALPPPGANRAVASTTAMVSCQTCSTYFFDTKTKPPTPAQWTG